MRVIREVALKLNPIKPLDSTFLIELSEKMLFGIGDVIQHK
jgi:hypothetical protein